MITVEELKAKFPVRDVAPYGSCIIVPGDQFDPDWEVFLGDQGYKCFFADLDRKPVTLVKLPKEVGKSEDAKEVYRPPSQVLAKHGNWTPEEDEVLIKLWNERLLIEKMTAHIPSRTEAAIRLRIQRLEKYGKIKKRTGRPKESLPKSSVRRWNNQEDQLLVQLWNNDMKVPDMLVHFPGRTRDSIAMHIDVLQKAGKISPRWKPGEGKRKPEKIAQAGSELSTPAPSSTREDTLSSTSKGPASEETETLKLLKEIQDLLQEESVFFESYCQMCQDRRTVEDSNLWKCCPVCGGPLIIWNVEAKEASA